MQKTKITLICCYLLQSIGMIVFALMVLTGHQFEISGIACMVMFVVKRVIFGNVFVKVFMSNLRSYSPRIYEYLRKKNGYNNGFLWLGYTLGLVGENKPEDKIVRKYLLASDVFEIIIWLEFAEIILVADNYALFYALCRAILGRT